jgi:hypothetical protein
VSEAPEATYSTHARLPRTVLRQAALVGVATLSTLAVACSMCGDEDYRLVSSPNRRYVAEYFVRNCGATTEYATWVRVKKRSCLLACSTTPYVEEGLATVELSWQGDDHLVIRCPRCASRPDRTWENVSISFQNATATTPSKE